MKFRLVLPSSLLVLGCVFAHAVEVAPPAALKASPALGAAAKPVDPLALLALTHLNQWAATGPGIETLRRNPDLQALALATSERGSLPPAARPVAIALKYHLAMGTELLRAILNPRPESGAKVAAAWQELRGEARQAADSQLRDYLWDLALKISPTSRDELSQDLNESKADLEIVRAMHAIYGTPTTARALEAAARRGPELEKAWVQTYGEPFGSAGRTATDTQSAKAPAAPLSSHPSGLTKPSAPKTLEEIFSPVSKERALKLAKGLGKRHPEAGRLDLDDPIQRSWLSPIAKSYDESEGGDWISAATSNGDPYDDALYWGAVPVVAKMTQLQSDAAQTNGLALERTIDEMRLLEPALHLYVNQATLARFHDRLVRAAEVRRWEPPNLKEPSVLSVAPPAVLPAAATTRKIQSAAAWPAWARTVGFILGLTALAVAEMVLGALSAVRKKLAAAWPAWARTLGLILGLAALAAAVGLAGYLFATKFLPTFFTLTGVSPLGAAALPPTKITAEPPLELRLFLSALSGLMAGMLSMLHFMKIEEWINRRWPKISMSPGALMTLLIAAGASVGALAAVPAFYWPGEAMAAITVLVFIMLGLFLAWA